MVDEDETESLESQTLKAMKDWRQGDVLEHSWVSRYALAGSSLVEDSDSEEEVDGDIALVDSKTEKVVVLSHTCDLVLSPVTRPFVTVAALVRTADAHVRRGTQPRYVPIPSQGDDAYVDTWQVMTVEKPLALTWARERGLRDDDEVREFQRALARSSSRFAFPNDLVNSTKKLVEVILKRVGKGSDEGRAVDLLREIRAVPEPSWQETAEGSVVAVLYFVAPDDRSIEEFPREALEKIVADWQARCVPQGIIERVDCELTSLTSMSAEQYKYSDPLDFDYLSEGEESSLGI